MVQALLLGADFIPGVGEVTMGLEAVFSAMKIVRKIRNATQKHHQNTSSNQSEPEPIQIDTSTPWTNQSDYDRSQAEIEAEKQYQSNVQNQLNLYEYDREHRIDNNQITSLDHDIYQNDDQPVEENPYQDAINKMSDEIAKQQYDYEHPQQQQSEQQKIIDEQGNLIQKQIMDVVANQGEAELTSEEQLQALQQIENQLQQVRLDPTSIFSRDVDYF